MTTLSDESVHQVVDRLQTFAAGLERGEREAVRSVVADLRESTQRRGGAGVASAAAVRAAAHQILRLSPHEAADAGIAALVAALDDGIADGVDAKALELFLSPHAGAAASAAEVALPSWVERVRHRILACAHAHSSRTGAEWHTSLPRHFDEPELRRVIRRVLKVKPSEVTDLELERMFHWLDPHATELVAAHRLLKFLSVTPVRSAAWSYSADETSGDRSGRGGRDPDVRIKWMKLDLTKAPNVRKEVDDAIRAFASALKDGQAPLIHALRAAFEQRIDQLEAFHLAHDEDERAGLFEKQRLRLRRALHASGPAPPVSAAAHAVGGGARARGSPSAVLKSPIAASAGKAKSPTGSGRRGGKPQPVFSPAGNAAKPASARTFGGMTHPELDGEAASPAGPDKPERPRAGPGAPLYSWERNAADEHAAAPVRVTSDLPIATDHGAFFPTNVSGIYEAQMPPPVSPNFIDMQIILTEAEFRQYSTQRRADKAAAKHAHRFSTKRHDESDFLFSSIPYMEPARIESSLYRFDVHGEQVPENVKV